MQQEQSPEIQAVSMEGMKEKLNAEKDTVQSLMKFLLPNTWRRGGGRYGVGVLSRARSGQPCRGDSATAATVILSQFQGSGGAHGLGSCLLALLPVGSQGHRLHPSLLALHGCILLGKEILLADDRPRSQADSQLVRSQAFTFWHGCIVQLMLAAWIPQKMSFQAFRSFNW